MLKILEKVQDLEIHIRYILSETQQAPHNQWVVNQHLGMMKVISKHFLFLACLAKSITLINFLSTSLSCIKKDGIYGLRVLMKDIIIKR